MAMVAFNTFASQPSSRDRQSARSTIRRTGRLDPSHAAIRAQGWSLRVSSGLILS
jgi:hypothetical protein